MVKNLPKLPTRYTFILCITLLLPLVIPLFTSYIPGTADGLAHKFRAVSFAQSLKEGNIRPRWLGEPAMGYGSPIFLFNYLTPYYFIATFILGGVGVNLSAQIYLAMTIILSGFVMYLLCNRLWGTKAGIVAAIAYAASPYHLLVTYTYEGWGEVTAFVFPPLLLYLTLSIVNSVKVTTNIKYQISNIKFIALIAAWFLFILSHNPSVLMFTPIILGITLLLARGEIRAIVQLLSAFVLAVFLSAFFWLPALTLTPLIRVSSVMAREAALRQQFFKSIFSQIQVAVNTLKNGTVGNYDFSLGLPIFVAAVSVLGYLGYLGFIRFKKRIVKISRGVWLIGSLVVFCLSLYLVQPSSNWVWDTIKPLNFIIYPFRFLAPATFAGSLLVGFIGRRSTLIAVVLILFCFITARPFINPRVDIFPFGNDYFYQPNTVRFAPGTRKTMGTVEFLPRSANINHLEKVENSYIATRILPQKFLFSNAATKVTQTIREESQSVTYEAREEQLLTVATHYFPNWEAELDGKKQPLGQDLQGRITATVPGGSHVFTLRFGKTPIEKFADGLSLTTLFGLVTVAILLKFRFLRI